MKGILNLLARANLLELSEDERQEAGVESLSDASDALGADAAAAMGHVAPPESVPEVPVLSAAECEIVGDKPFEELYREAGLAEAPFPAEKLLRLLDGLRAMDAETRKAAVLAMDAADDNWQIADCVRDAGAKVAVIESYKQHLAAQVVSGDQYASAQIKEVEAGLATATEAIRRQIAELEQLLQREIAGAAQRSASLEAALRAAREASARETRRMDAEIERLREITASFGVANPATPAN